MKSALIPVVLMSTLGAAACGQNESSDATASDSLGGTTSMATTVDGTMGSETDNNPTATEASQGGTDEPGDSSETAPGTASNAESSDDGQTGDPTTDDSASTDTGGSPNQLPPTNAAELRAWLEASSYDAWTAESGVHVSAGPHGNGVRAFVNDALFASLGAGNPTHPAESAVVKELYDGGAIVGWAVTVKLANGGGGDSWYWYENIGEAIYADGPGVALCTNCHADGADYVLSPFPLQ